jgi:F-type H+-transporting ATPase subunit a
MENDSAFNIALNCLFTPINVATVVVPIVSLSFRLFGNALAGLIVMTLIYSATASVSAKITSLGTAGVAIALGALLVLLVIRQIVKTKKFKFTPGLMLLTLIFGVTVAYTAAGLEFNIVGVFVGPLLHLYFDVFGTYVQTMVFLFLSSIFIADEKVEA